MGIWVLLPLWAVPGKTKRRVRSRSRATGNEIVALGCSHLLFRNSTVHLEKIAWHPCCRIRPSNLELDIDSCIKLLGADCSMVDNPRFWASGEATQSQGVSATCGSNGPSSKPIRYILANPSCSNWLVDYLGMSLSVLANALFGGI